MNFLTKLKEQATKLTQRLNPKIEVIQITDQMYHCPYPTDMNAFKQIIKQLQSQRLKIYNLSEYPYSQQIKQKLAQLNIEICELTYEYYSSMPLTLSIAQIIKIESYVKNASNFVLVHCQENKSRSTVFLAMYYYLSGRINDVASALAQVNKRLGLNSNQTVYSSQHLLLKNVANYHQDPSFINKQQLRLIKVIINQAPKLPEIVLLEDQPLTLFLEIRRNGKPIYKKVTKQFGQGEIVQFNLRQDHVVLSDDCLFSFKYVYREKAYPVARIQINTNFVFNNFLRVQMQEMDIAKNATTTMQVFTDFIFQTIPQTQSQLAKLGKKETHIDIQSHYDKSKNKLSPTLLNKRNNTKQQSKSPLLQIKTNVNQKQTQKKPEQQQKIPKKQNKVQEQQDAFHINDELGTTTDGENVKLTEEHIDQMLVNMAMKKAQVTEQIKQAAQEDQQNEQQVQQQKDDQIDKKQTEQIKQLEKLQQSQKLEIQQQKIEQKQQIKQTQTQSTQKIQQKQKNKEKDIEQTHQDVDIDDYLSKLEEQADQN